MLHVIHLQTLCVCYFTQFTIYYLLYAYCSKITFPKDLLC